MTTLQNDKFFEYGIKVGIPLLVVALFCVSVGVDLGSWTAIGMVSLAAMLMQGVLMLVLEPRKAALAGWYGHLWAASGVLLSLGSAVVVHVLFP